MTRIVPGCRLRRSHERTGFRVVRRGGVDYLYRDTGLGLSYVQQPYRPAERVRPRRCTWRAVLRALRCDPWLIAECAVWIAVVWLLTWMFVCRT